MTETPRPWHEANDDFDDWIVGPEGETVMVSSMANGHHNRALIIAAVNACHALGIAPDRLEITVRALVKALRPFEEKYRQGKYEAVSGGDDNTWRVVIREGDLRAAAAIVREYEGEEVTPEP
jgi:hypothetical protein